MLFDLLRPGASGDTTNQICDIVGLCGPRDTLLWNDTITALTMDNTGECSLFDDGGCYALLPLIKIANSIWIDMSSELQPGYSEIVGEYLQLTDFASENAGGTVNSWVNTSTLGLIDSIIDEGPIFHELVAINSIYLKAYWRQQFSEARTNEDFFYKDASREEVLPDKAHFMHSVGYLAYSHAVLPGYQIISLGFDSAPYDNLSMVLVLPLLAGATSVSSNDVVDVLPLPSGRSVALAIPKFRIESTYATDLKDSLTALGLTAPFDIRHGFCGLIDGCLFIDLLVHKTFIEVNEEGTTAAAVTLAALMYGAGPPSGPVLFVADHPFQFFIYDVKEDLILFEGRVGAPTILEDWSPAQFKAVHSDPDFWTSNFYLESPPVQPEPPSQPTHPSTTHPSTTQPPPVQTTQSGSIRDDDPDSSSPAKRFVTAHWTTCTAAFITAFIATF